MCNLKSYRRDCSDIVRAKESLVLGEGIFMNKLSIIKTLVKALATKPIDKKIFYVHIPKCGGTSLQKAITEKYGIQAYLVPGHVFHLDAAASVRASDKLGVDLLTYRNQLLYYAMTGKTHFISGHFNFNEEIANSFGQEWNFITMIREPVKKWLSKFYFNKYNADPNHVWKINVSLEEFLNSDEAISYGSDYVTNILGKPDKALTVSGTDISKTISLLEKFSIVGILEETDQFSTQFKNAFGSPIYLTQANTSPAKARDKTITPEIEKKIRELCAPNLAIYNHFASKTTGVTDSMPHGKA